MSLLQHSEMQCTSHANMFPPFSQRHVLQPVIHPVQSPPVTHAPPSGAHVQDSPVASTAQCSPVAQIPHISSAQPSSAVPRKLLVLSDIDWKTTTPKIKPMSTPRATCRISATWNIGCHSITRFFHANHYHCGGLYSQVSVSLLQQSHGIGVWHVPSIHTKHKLPTPGVKPSVGQSGEVLQGTQPWIGS